MRSEPIYLSKSRLRALWPDLPLTGKERLRLSEIAAKASVSLSPSLEVSTKWSPSASQGSALSDWPPWESEEFVAAIDHYIEKLGGAGTWNDIATNSAVREFYDLAGRLVANDRSQPVPLMFGFSQSDVIELRLAGPNKLEVPLVLALENLHGIERADEGWSPVSSLIFLMFQDISFGNGFAVRGMFTAERAAEGPIKTLRATYLKH